MQAPMNSDEIHEVTLTDNLPKTGGLIKVEVDDFEVEELPAYEPCGSGEHVLAWIEKRGITTDEAVTQLCDALHVSRAAIGVAGRKDRVGVTVQQVSVLGPTPEEVQAVEADSLRVLRASRHNRKIRLGHLHGNRFHIVVRGVVADAAARAEAVMAVLRDRGLPNAFGAQRFGRLGRNAVVGRTLLLGGAQAMCDALLGPSAEDEAPLFREAGERYQRGDWAGAKQLWPKSFADERRLLLLLGRAHGDVERAIAWMPRRVWYWYASAYQSLIFNRCLSARLASLDEIWEGDVAVKHPSLAPFQVEDVMTEQARAERWEISPAGPLMGERMLVCRDRALALEEQVLVAEGVTPDHWKHPALGPRSRGDRRPYRVRPQRVVIEQDDDVLHLDFVLPAGAYATVLLREIMG